MLHPGKPRYKPTEITNIADNMLLFQKDNGRLAPKTTTSLPSLQMHKKDSVRAGKDLTNTTFDNGSTYTQIAALAIAYAATNADKYKNSRTQRLRFHRRGPI